MATGDIKNNLKKLHSELKRIRLPENMLNLKGLASGDVTAYLGIYDYLFQWYNTGLAKEINEKNLKLPILDPADPTKFLEGMYLVLRDMFSWKPPLTVVQLKSSGFAEKKVIMCNEVIKLVTSYRGGPPVKSSDQPQLTHSGIKMIRKSAVAIGTLVKETPALPKKERTSALDVGKNPSHVRTRRSPSEGLLFESKRKPEESIKLYQTAPLKKESERGQFKGVMKAVENTVIERVSKMEEIIHSFEERLSKLERMSVTTPDVQEMTHSFEERLSRLEGTSIISPLDNGEKQLQDYNDINSNQVSQLLNTDMPLEKAKDNFLNTYSSVQSSENGNGLDRNGENLRNGDNSGNLLTISEEM